MPILHLIVSLCPFLLLSVPSILLITRGAGLVLKSSLTLWTPWTVTHQTPLTMGFPRQEYWSGLPFPSPGIFLTQGWNSDLNSDGSPALQVDSLLTEPPGKPADHLGPPNKHPGCQALLEFPIPLLELPIRISPSTILFLPYTWYF